MSNGSLETCPTVGLDIEGNGSGYPGYFGKWPEYLLGGGARERVGNVLVRSGVVSDRTEFNWGGVFPHDLDKKTAELLGEVQRGLRPPTAIGDHLYENGIRSDDLYDPEASYRWVVESSYAYRESLTTVESILPDLVKEAYAKNPTGTLVISDLGCGPGVVTARLIPIILAALPEDVNLRLRMEDLDPLATVTCALLARELKEKYGNRLDIEVKCRDVREADPSDQEPTHFVLGSLSVLPYLSIKDQQKVIERMNKMGANTAVFSGNVNGFDALEYLLGKNNGSGWPLHGLRREWGFLSHNWTYTRIGMEMSRSHRGVYPNLIQVMEMYHTYGWKTKVEGVFIPEDGDPSDLNGAGGVVLSLKRDGNASGDL